MPTSSSAEVHRLQSDMAEHHARVADSIAALAGGLNSADGIFNTGTQWMEEWNALASIGSDGGVQKKEDAVTYDVAIFGPELTGEGPALGAEVRSILLAKDRDFTDAIINIDRDNFSGSAFDCAQRDIQVFRNVCAGVYTTNRQLFVHATPLDQAMGKAIYYRMMIRHMRSQLYVADLLSESVDKLAERIYSLEVIKDKYEATIFTLRRQLDDYHRANGGVGRDPNGELVSYVQQHTAASPSLGLAIEEVPCAFVVVQVEELGNLRVRQRRVIEEGLVVLKRTIVALGNSFEGIRTNYHDENEKKEAYSMPDAYMMRFESCFAAVAFSAALHLELNTSKGLWPQQLLEMTRFSKEATWTGLRVRVGVHFGNPATMDGPQGTMVQHFEGPAVDKAIRVASKGVAGDTCISTAAWDVYTTEKKEGRVPPSKKYTHLRTLVSDAIDCGRDIGFKVGEHVTKVWVEELGVRKEEPLEIDYSPISFFGIELSQVRHDDAAPTAEELLNAKDTELTLAQQEMDKMKLAIIKKDADAEMLKEEMMGAMNSLRSHMSIRMFRAEQASECLETQLMTAHDALSSIESTARMATTNAESIVEVDKRRRERFIVWEEGHDDPQPNLSGNRTLSKVESFRGPKHKNIQLWKKLNGLVNAASSKTVDNVTRNASIKSKKGEAEADTYSTLFRVHRIIRTFGLLVRQFVAEGNIEDSDNQNISEDQFMTLFLRMTQDSVVGSHREVFNQKGFAAIESDDVEEANLGDDARLSRSVVGHLVRLFTIFKAYRVKSIVDSNRQDIDKDQSIQAAAPPKPATKKGGKGPSKSVPVPPAQQIKEADKENQKLWKEVTELQFKLASANESLRKSEERAQILSSSKPTAPKGTPSAPNASPPISRIQPTPATPTHGLPTVQQTASQPMTSQAVPPTTPQATTPQSTTPQATTPQATTPQATTPQATTPQATTPQSTTLQSTTPQATTLQLTPTQAAQSVIIQPITPTPLTSTTTPLVESKATQIPEGGGLSLVLVQDNGVIKVPHTTHIDMEFTDRPAPSEQNVLTPNDLTTHASGGPGGFISYVRPTSPHVDMPKVSGNQMGVSRTPVSSDAISDQSNTNLGVPTTGRDDTHIPPTEESHPNRIVSTSSVPVFKGPQKRVDSSGRQAQTPPDVAFRAQRRPPDSSSVGELVVCSSGAQSSSGQRAVPHPTRRHAPTIGVDPTPNSGMVAGNGEIGIRGIRSLSNMEVQPSSHGTSLDPSHIGGTHPQTANAHVPLDVRGYGANHPVPTPHQPRASQSEGLVVHAALDGTSPLSVKGLSPLKRDAKQHADDSNVTNPVVHGRGLLSPIQGVSLTAGHRSPEVEGPTPPHQGAENVEWDSPAAHRSVGGKSPKPAAHGDRTTPDGVLRGTELHFAMNRPDNQAVLKQAEVERDAYLLKQDRLQRQLAELKELQAISKHQLNVNGSQQGRAADPRPVRQFVPFGGVELKPQSRHSKKV